MASPEQVQAAAACYSYLQDKLAVLIYLFNTNGMTPEQLQANAACYSYLQDKLGILVYLLASGAGGGGGGAANIYVKNYAGGTPTDTPASGNASAFDTSNGAIWAYNGSVWTQFVL